MLDNKLINVLNVFKKIQSVSGRLEKEQILKENEGNVEFRKVLEFVYNPYILTGIKAKKLEKFIEFYDEDYPVKLHGIFDAMKYIEENNTGRDEDVKAVANFINGFANNEVKSFLVEVFTKDLKVGITSSTINKVYGKNTIPEFNVLLAKSYKDYSHKLKGEFFVTLKLDGIRCICVKKNNSVQFFTRQGQPIDDLIEIEEELKLKMPDNYVLDGELLLKPNGMNSADLFRATQKVVRKDGVKVGLEFHVFDGLPVDEFVNGKSKLKYTQRRRELEEGVFNTPYEHVKHLPVLYVGEDKEVISDLLSKVIEEGKEGLMVNVADGYYVNKRSDTLLKVKEMQTVDLRVIGLEEGSGKFTRTLGTLIVDYKGYQVKVGSGYTDFDRGVLWSMGEDVIGRVVEVQYFEESSNQDGGISLRFPVFKALREEGKEVSYD